MTTIRFTSHSIEDTERLGAALADTLPGGTTVALSGTLGAGKTMLVQAIAAASGIPREQVVSPTFVLCQQYHGRRALYHLDTYRLADEDQFLELGPEEYFESDGITLVEWAERVADCLPSERIEIQIEIRDENSRDFYISGIGQGWEEVLAELGRRLEAEKR